MARLAVLTCVCVLLGVLAGRAQAHSWFSNYSTGSPEFQDCCGYDDCHTAASLGYPEIRRRDDGGYNVRLEKSLLQYDFPAVHTSHDSNTWICFMGEAAEQPDPLCLFLPAGIM